MMKYALVFPGQGSQSIGMLADLNASYPVIKQTFAEASELLGYDLWKLTQTGPEADLNQTDKTQPALLAASVAVWRVWREQGVLLPAVMAGHSFGEYSALVCAGALKFTDAVGLVQDRGRFMQAAVLAGEGAMAALIGLSPQQVTEICDQVAQGQIVAPVNFNAPGQIVIAGHTPAVNRAIEQAKRSGAKKAVLLPVSVPAHSQLMKPAAEKMAGRLAQIAVTVPNIPVIHNVDVAVKSDAAAIRSALTTQLYSPVRWVETIEKMVTEGIKIVFECGPGKVLTGLNKRIAKTVTTLSIGDSHRNLEEAVAMIEKTVVCI
jgi:[acyl-carrier-protein] S-malonyltransferase